MMIPVVPMQDISPGHFGMGNKVKNLAHLSQAGVRVPRGFGLPYSVYEEHVRDLLPDMKAIRTKSSDYAVMARGLRKVVMGSPLRAAQEVMTATRSHMPGASYFAVRSSGSPVVNGLQVAEDSAETSLAGQYESFLLVPVYNVPNAILACFSSLFRERCLQQFKAHEDGDYLQSSMSVLVQEMCPADLSAVVMTRDPIEGGDIFGVEITYGACEAIVSGEVQGDLYLLSRTTGTILSAEVGSKTSRVEYEPLINMEVTNRKIISLSNDQRSCYAASEDVVAQIFDISMFIEDQFDAPQDIELVVYGGEIIVTQTRPITTGN